ncbi:hypothetical protein BY458DRAFT_444168 [Sporodiniella umbellata]|nr:hypothetical protein BY458DRAFT_444168 [Sporodiniella umbellata]
MSEMVRWEEEDILKRQVKHDIQIIERLIQQEHLDETIVTVAKEIVRNLAATGRNTWTRTLIGTGNILWGTQMPVTFLAINNKILC